MDTGRHKYQRHRWRRSYLSVSILQAEVYYTGHTEHGAHVLAFGRGLEALGWAVRFGDPSGFKGLVDIHRSTDMLVFWGLKGPSKIMKDAAAAKGLKCAVVELPYFRGNGKRSVSILQDGYYLRHNNNGDFLGSAAMPSDRLDVKVKSRKDKTDGFILVCGQVPGDAQTCEIDIRVWEEKIIDRLVKSGEEVVYRPHPNVKKSDQSLEDQLDNCKAMVAYNSTATVECIIKGVPFWSPERSQYSPMACTMGEWKAKPKKDREQFLANLAYCDYSKDEFFEGGPVAHIESIIKGRKDGW